LTRFRYAAGCPVCRRAAELAAWPAQRQIAHQVDAETVEELERRKRADFDAFLHASNARALFRDIVVPSEYDALQPRRRAVRYTTRELVDPVKQDMLRVRRLCVAACGWTTEGRWAHRTGKSAR
jgi:hypothetical protein